MHVGRVEPLREVDVPCRPRRALAPAAPERGEPGDAAGEVRPRFAIAASGYVAGMALLPMLASAVCFAIALVLELRVFTGSDPIAWAFGGALAFVLACLASGQAWPWPQRVRPPAA